VGTVVSFDIDGTLEIGDPPGIITIGAVRAARRLGYVVGSCSDRPLAHQHRLWQRLELSPDFTVLKHRLADCYLAVERAASLAYFAALTIVEDDDRRAVATAMAKAAAGECQRLLARDGLIATVTLNRPDRRNSLSDPMLTELGAALAELRDDPSTRVVIVTGAPPVFSAGADAGLKSSMSAEERRQAFASRKSQFRRLFERANTVLEGLEQTTIAAINGHAVGGGWGLTLACDFRIAAAEAQLWIPEVDLGVPLGVASTTRFVRLVGPARAKEIIMDCRRYSAEAWTSESGSTSSAARA